MNAGKKLVIGLTGHIKSGKTTVADYLKKYGFYVLNVDKFAHKLYKKGTILYKKIIKNFGNDFLKPDLTINRKKLSLKVFSNKKTYKKFCSLIYPYLNKELEIKIKKLKQKIIFLDMAVLFESGFYQRVDYIVFVSVSKNIWIKRVKNYNNFDFIERAFNYQNIFNLSKKIALSDFIIYNNKSKRHLYYAVDKLIIKIKGYLWKKKTKN